MQSRLDNLERNLSDRIKDVGEKQKELGSEMKMSFKNQKTFAIITWVLIVIATILILVLKNH